MKADIKKQLMLEIEAEIHVRFKAQVSAARAVSIFLTEVDSYRDLELYATSEPLLRKILYQIASKAVAREEAEEDMDSEPEASTADTSLLAEAKREIKETAAPTHDGFGNKHNETADEWRTAALAGVRRLLDHKVEGDFKARRLASYTAWIDETIRRKPELASQREQGVANARKAVDALPDSAGDKPERESGEPLSLREKIRLTRGLKAINTDTPTRFRPERKAEVAEYMLSKRFEPWTTSEETEWIESELRPELKGAPKIKGDVLRAKAPPGMFNGVSASEFQVKISRHRKKLGINK